VEHYWKCLQCGAQNLSLTADLRIALQVYKSKMTTAYIFKSKIGNLYDEMCLEDEINFTSCTTTPTKRSDVVLIDVLKTLKGTNENINVQCVVVVNDEGWNDEDRGMVVGNIVCNGMLEGEGDSSDDGSSETEPPSNVAVLFLKSAIEGSMIYRWSRRRFRDINNFTNGKDRDVILASHIVEFVIAALVWTAVRDNLHWSGEDLLSLPSKISSLTYSKSNLSWISDDPYGIKLNRKLAENMAGEMGMLADALVTISECALGFLTPLTPTSSTAFKVLLICGPSLLVSAFHDVGCVVGVSVYGVSVFCYAISVTAWGTMGKVRRTARSTTTTTRLPT